MWDLPGPGLEHVSPALAGGFLTTAPRGQSKFDFFFYKFYFICLLFLAALGLRCYTQAFSSCGEQGLLFVGVRGLLIAVASLVVEHGL